MWYGKIENFVFFYFNLSIIVLRIWIAISIPKAISSVYIKKEKALSHQNLHSMPNI